MKISIKSEEEIQKMRIAGRLAAEVLEMIEPYVCLLYTSPSPRDVEESRMPSSA